MAILRARVIRAEVNIENLATRLSLATTLDQNMTEIIDRHPGLAETFSGAVAVRFVEIAVQYRRPGRDGEETLDFTLSDRNTCSLHSLEDPFQIALGHRLLREWKIYRDGRPPEPSESIKALPALLALWDMGTERITGAWLKKRGIDPSVLIELGFLVHDGWADDDLLDDDDGIGQQVAEVVVRPEGVDLRPSVGQDAPGGAPEAYHVYRVRDGWVAQHLREQVASYLDRPAVEEISRNLLSLGTLRIDDRDVPIYLVRGIRDDRVRAAVDTELRARHQLGIGLVLQAGRMAGSCFAANVLSPLVDHIDRSTQKITLSVDGLRTVFRRNRLLAAGGQTVELVRSGKHAATLSVPKKGTIFISGKHRVDALERLVDAHNKGATPMATADLKAGLKDQSLSNMFGQPLWSKLKADFLRSPRNGLWEIAT